MKHVSEERAKKGLAHTVCVCVCVCDFFFGFVLQ